ncbi:MAG: hypothetical protein Cons2KO_20110 [Congregibacter sp.]
MYSINALAEDEATSSRDPATACKEQDGKETRGVIAAMTVAKVAVTACFIGEGISYSVYVRPGAQADGALSVA